MASKIQRSKDWNPATFFICIFLLIGSNGIQMLTLRNEYSSFSRKADQKIALLKEVLEKVQKGEQVDVEKVLGTGDEEQEREWEDVIKHIGEEDNLWQSRDRRREKRQLNKEQKANAQVAEGEALSSTTNENFESVESPPGKAKKPTFY